MFKNLFESFIIVSILMFVFGIYCIFFLQTGGYTPSFIIPTIMLVCGIIGKIKKQKDNNDETDEPED